VTWRERADCAELMLPADAVSQPAHVEAPPVVHHDGWAWAAGAALNHAASATATTHMRLQFIVQISLHVGSARGDPDNGGTTAVPGSGAISPFLRCGQAAARRG